MLYSHFSKVPASKWRWKYFTPREIASKGEGELLINEDALDRLERLRIRLGKPMFVTSGYRSKAHNQRVGGAKASKHLEGTAFDISMTGHDPHEFIAAARLEGFTGIGTYPRQGFVHIDTGPKRVWGDPFPQKTPPVLKPVPVPPPVDPRPTPPSPVPLDPKKPEGEPLSKDIIVVLVFLAAAAFTYLVLNS